MNIDKEIEKSIVEDNVEEFQNLINNKTIDGIDHIQNLLLFVYENNAYSIFEYIIENKDTNNLNTGIYTDESMIFQYDDTSNKATYEKNCFTHMLIWNPTKNSIRAARKILSRIDNPLKLYRNGVVYYKNSKTQKPMQCQRHQNCIALCIKIITSLNEKKTVNIPLIIEDYKQISIINNDYQYLEKLIEIYEFVEYIIRNTNIRLDSICEKHIHHDTRKKVDFRGEIKLEELLNFLDDYIRLYIKRVEFMKNDCVNKTVNILKNISKLLYSIEYKN